MFSVFIHFISLILQFCSESLGDTAKAESKQEDHSDEEGEETEEVVPVRRLHHAVIQSRGRLQRVRLER